MEASSWNALTLVIGWILRSRIDLGDDVALLDPLLGGRAAFLHRSHEQPLDVGRDSQRLGQLRGEWLDFQAEVGDRRLVVAAVELGLLGASRSTSKTTLSDATGTIVAVRSLPSRRNTISYGLATSLVATLSLNDEGSFTFAPAKPMMTSPSLRPALSAGLSGNDAADDDALG